MRDFMVVVLGGLMMSVVLALIILLWGLPLMWLWNWLMPVLFGLPTITFWQAVGLNLMSHILFKSSPSTTKTETK